MSKTFRFNSKSSDAVHTVTVHNEGTVTCSCFGFRTAKDGKCWHVKKVEKEEDITPTEPVQNEFFESVTGFISPMLASGIKDGRTMDDFPREQWAAEEKFDGHRLIIKVSDNAVTAWSRNQNVRVLAPEIVNDLSLLPPGTYDGELIIPGHTSTDVTALEMSDSSCLMIFDILMCGEESVTALSYANRHNLLKLLLFKKMTRVFMVEQVEVSQEMLESIWKRGGEGVIIKKRSSKYDIGHRSKSWIKFKKLEAAQLTLIGFKEGRLGLHSMLILRDDNGVEITVKARNDEWRSQFARDPESFIGKTVVISYQNRTRSGKYRHPMADHFLGEQL